MTDFCEEYTNVDRCCERETQCPVQSSQCPVPSSQCPLRSSSLQSSSLQSSQCPGQSSSQCPTQYPVPSSHPSLFSSLNLNDLLNAVGLPLNRNEDLLSSLLGPPPQSASHKAPVTFRQGSGYTTGFDVMSTDNETKVFVDLPGVVVANVSVNLKGRVLTVSANRVDTTLDEMKNVTHTFLNRSFGKTQLSFNVMEGVTRNNVQVNLGNGVLTVTVTHPPEQKGDSIPVTSN